MMESISELLFDPNLYSSLYPDLKAAGLTTTEQLLEHAKTFGVAEGRQLSLFVDLKVYAEVNPDLEQAGLTSPEKLLDHLQKFGLKEKRRFSPFIDLESYGELYPDLAAAGLTTPEQLLEHLQTFGLQEKRRFSLTVDLNFYSSTYSDLGAAGLTSFEQLLEHLQIFGLKEGRRFSPFIDLQFYGENNPDLTAAGLTTPEELLEHLQEFGIEEGRLLAPEVDLRAYQARYADLRAAFQGDLTKVFQHLVEFGWQEGRAYDPNDAPIVGQQAPDATATAGGAINIQLPDGIFADPDAVDAPTLTATLEDGSPLPSWLTFDPETLTFSGTPAATDSGTLKIKVTLTDILGATASNTFALQVAGGTGGTDTGTTPPSGTGDTDTGTTPTGSDTGGSTTPPSDTETPPPTPSGNNPPVAGAIASQTISLNAPFSFTVPAGTFSDPDGDILTYTASKEDGTPLPAWLTFNPDTLTFTGTATLADAGSFNIRVAAIDPLSQTATATFTLAAGGKPPTLDKAIADQKISVDTAFSFAIPAGTFSDPEGKPLSFSATLEDGSPLPAWLGFDPATGTFSGTPTAADINALKIKITATDTDGFTATDTLDLGVGITDAVEALFAAYEAAQNNPGDTAFVGLLTDSATLTIAGDPNRVLFAGQYAGQNIQSYFGRLVAAILPFDSTGPADAINGFEPLEFIEEGNRVAVRIRQEGVGTQTGKYFQNDWTFLVTVEPGGKISAVEGYYNSYPIAAAIADQTAPAIPADDPLSGQAATADLNADSEAALQIAQGMWTALISNNFNPNDPNSFQNLSDPNATWSFAVGGPSFLPYVGAATGLQNAGDELLRPLGSVVAPGTRFDLVNSFADGNRVLLHYRETGARVIETGNTYDLDLFSWITVENGKVKSNQVIVDTSLTVNALRPFALSPLSPNPAETRHAPPYFVTGSGISNTLLAYDESGNFIGVLGQANANDTDEFIGPIGLTYGPDGNVYVAAGISRATGQIVNAVLRFDGMSGEFIGNGTDGASGAGGQTDPFGDAFVFLDFSQNPPTPLPGPTGSLGSFINPATGAPFNPAVDVGVTPVPGLFIPTGLKFGPDPDNPGQKDLYVSSGFTSRILRYDGETGQFLGTFGLRPNGAPGNFIVPGGDNTQPDFTVMVFGPDGNIYVTSILSDPDGDESNGEGAVIRFVGPDRVGPNGEPPGTLLGSGTYAAEGIFGQANNAESRLNEASALAFGPDLDLYVASAQTTEVMRFAGPTKPNAGTFLGVYADLNQNLPLPQGAVSGSLALSGLGFTPDGDLLVGSSFETAIGAPVGGSEFTRYAGPLKPNAGAYLGPFGEVSTSASRLLLPTTPEFVFTTNTFEEPNVPHVRYDRISFVVGVNTDTAGGSAAADGADVLAAFDKDGNFIKYIGQEQPGQDNIPLEGISGIVLSSEGNILVSSRGTNQVLEFDGLTGEYIGVFGQANQTDAGLNGPAGLALGTNNDIFVVDRGNARVLWFDGQTGQLVGDVDGDGATDEVAFTADPATDRLTTLAFGSDGRSYIADNPVAPAAGQAQIQVYNAFTGQIETTRNITGLDYVSSLKFGPDGRLYAIDNPSALTDPVTGQPIDPAKESQLKVYEIDNVHPILDPPVLVNSVNIGVGNGSGLSVGPDGTILVANSAAGTVARYDASLQLLGTSPVPLPPAGAAIDADGLARVTDPVFIAELPY